MVKSCILSCCIIYKFNNNNGTKYRLISQQHTFINNIKYKCQHHTIQQYNNIIYGKLFELPKNNKWLDSMIQAAAIRAVI